MTMVSTTCIQGELVIANPVYRQETLTFAGADEFVAGTILARDSSTTKLVPFVVGGASGSGTPVAVLPYTVSATGAGDKKVSALISGQVRKDKLVIEDAADLSTLTVVHIDSLRDFGIIVVDNLDSSKLDNIA